MNLTAPARPLGAIDIEPLRSALQSLPEAVWQADTLRQDEYDNVHAATQSLILRFCDGWPRMTLREGSAWALLGAHVEPIMARLVARAYRPGGTILRAVLARLPAGAAIPSHRDAHPSFALAHRIHVPVITNPDVVFIIGQTRIHTRAGWAFEIDNRQSHSVANRGQEDRVHLIFDYAPPQEA